MEVFMYMIPTTVIVVLVGIVLGILSVVNKEAGAKFTPVNVIIEVIHFLLLTSISVALIQIGFAATEKWIPDLLVDNAWRMQSLSDAVRYSLAVLIIAGPIYVVMLRKTRMLAGEWMQKFMAGAAVFVAGLVAFCTLIALVYSFISGDLGLRFAAQMTVLLVVTGGIGMYYQFLLRKKVLELTRATNIYTIKVIAVVIVAVTVGFIVTGGPGKARAVRFDDRRLSDLSSLQWEIQSYFEKNNMMPKTLLDLDDAMSGYVLPADPRTKTAYEYRVVNVSTETVDYTTRNVATFELCATFETELNHVSGKDVYIVDTLQYRMGYESFLPSYYQGDTSPHWNHGIGRECFTRTVKREREQKPRAIDTTPFETTPPEVTGGELFPSGYNLQ